MAILRHKFWHYLLAFFPLLLTPVLFYALAEGYINLGGGGKDIIVVVPYFIWALIFLIVAIIFIIKHKTLFKWVIRSSAISIIAMVFLWAIAYLASWLGVA